MEQAAQIETVLHSTATVMGEAQMLRFLLLLVVVAGGFIVCLWLSARARRIEAPGRWRAGWLPIVIPVVVLVLIFLLPFLAVSMRPESIITKQLAGRYTSEFGARTGLDRNLLRAVFLVLMIPVGIWIRGLFSWDGKTRLRASRNLTLSTAVYYLALFLTTPLIDPAAGQDVKVVFVGDRPIRTTNPLAYGISPDRAVPLTPELVERYPTLASTPVSVMTRLTAPKIPLTQSLSQRPPGVDPEFWPFFNPHDNHARVFYEEDSSGRIHAYTNARFSPLTQRPLQPFTPEIALRYAEQCGADYVQEGSGRSSPTTQGSGDGSATAVSERPASSEDSALPPRGTITSPAQVAAARQSARLNPQNAVFQAAAARACAATGDVNGARWYYRKVLELDPSNGEARRELVRLGGRP